LDITEKFASHAGSRWVYRLGVALLMTLLLAGCEGLPVAPAATPVPVRSLTEPTATATATEVATAIPTVAPTEEPATESTSEGIGVPPGGEMTNPGGSPTELIERAKAEVAGLARSSAENVQVVSVEAVDWSDSSLGCPKAGMMYAQVITPGYKIVLESGGNTYEFHTTRNSEGPLVRCGGQRK
jgi:hypothetical protein